MGRLAQRLIGWAWQISPLFRGPARKLRGKVGDWRHRFRRVTTEASAPRIRVTRAKATSPLSPVLGAGFAFTSFDDTTRQLSSQTENALGTDRDAAYLLPSLDGLDTLPPTHLEALVLAAAAEDHDWVIGGWAAPGDDPGQPTSTLFVSRDFACPDGDLGALQLQRNPKMERRTGHGRVVPHITAPHITALPKTPASSEEPAVQPVDDGLFTPAGPYRLPPSTPPGRIVPIQAHDLEHALFALPSVNGPPTVLFLLPFLAIGGAEHLLFDLIAGLKTTYRCLIVTLEPHRSSLGQTVDRARELVDGVYTLGDWLPREAHDGALRHLIRRWRVDTLMSWNGTVLFHDHATAWKRRFPTLRIVHQVYNHRGGWIDHLGPRLIAAIDGHVAINHPIERALIDMHGVAAERVSVVHHGVALPEPSRDDTETRAIREELGLPVDDLVVASFIRLHRQKRPADILAVARRFTGRGVSFLLAGGGPLEAAIEKELVENPIANLVRLPFRRDVDRLYQAADLVLSTSDFEGLPVFLLDALARGIPAVATGVGDIPLLLADGGGIVVERPGDLDALCRAIDTLRTPERRIEAGRRGRATIRERFSLERYVDGYRRAIFPETDMPEVDVPEAEA